MPCACPLPIPATMLPGGPLNQFDWLSLGPNEAGGIQQGAVMRGHPGALSFYHRRQISGPTTMGQAGPFYLQSRPYSRGAGAYSPKFGVLNINPIGAGIHAPYKLPVSGGPAARYEMAAIWFDVQTVPTSLRMSPTIPIASAEALIGQSHVAAMYATTG